ncbi:hypothetical protein ATCC90586_005020 [Pythium insidiosum]|nr:hypothetical protein ATCC90586_005020 [Pythium insidiosum]
MKTEYGSQNIEEGQGFLRPVRPAADGQRKSKRSLAVGASFVLLAAGAACAYMAMPDGKAIAPETLEASNQAAFVIPTEEEHGDLEEVYVPPFELLDTNADGAISNQEYLNYLSGLRDEAIQRVEASRLPQAKKTEYITRLHSNFNKEAGCVTRLANRDRRNNGLVTEERFELFHSMIREFCTIEDVVIPPEFQPTEAPRPDRQEEEPEEVPMPTYAPKPEPIPEPTYAPEPIPEPTYVPHPEPEPTYAPEPIPEPTYLIYVEVYGDVLWGVNRAQQIWVGSSVGDPQWRQLPGSLKQITSDNKQVCGVNANDDIWCANAAIRTNPNWRQVPGKLSFVKLLNGRLVGTNSNGDIFTGRSSGDPAWKQLGGKLRQVSFDGGRLCGTNSDNDVWCADGGLSATPNWSPVGGKRRFVVSNSGEMYSVNDQGAIFYRQINSGEMYSVNDQGAIFYRQM